MRTNTRTRFLAIATLALVGAVSLAAIADFKIPAPNPASSATSKTSIANGFYLAEDGTYVGMRGDVAATSATAAYSDNLTTQTSGKIHSFRTGGTEKSYIDFAGNFFGTAGAGLNITDATGTTATLVTIAASSASQTTEAALSIAQSGTTTGYTGNFVSLTGSSTTGTGNLLSLTCVNTTNGSCESVTSNALTTGTALIVPHTTSVIANGGSLLRLSSTSIDTGTTTGNLLDLSATASVAGNLVNIAASNASQTTETALSVTQSGTTTGYTGNFVSLTGSSTTGSGNLFSLTCVNTSAGSCESITDNAVTTGTAFTIPHTTSVIANGGSLAALSSTSIDTGTTTGNLLDLSATASVAGTLARISASNASQTTETALAVTQSGTTTGYTGTFANFTCSSTTGTGTCVGVNGVNTTAGTALLVNANSATTTTAVGLSVSATALTTGTAVKIKGGSEANVTTAGRYLSVQDSAGAEQFSVGADTHQVFAQTTLPVVTNTSGSGPSCTGCTDSNGKIVVTTAANTNVITLTFNTSATARGCIITPADANTAVDLKAAGGGIVAMNAGNFTITAPSANWAANQKNIYYSCFF